MMGGVAPGMHVSFVIPAATWDDYLERALASIAGQDLPDGVEAETVVALRRGARTPDAVPDGVVIVENPDGRIPTGLNLAVRAAAGEVVLRVDSRSVLPKGYLRRVLEVLADPRVGCVGGAALVLDRGLFGSAYAVAFNSPLLGPSRYRFSRTSGLTDSPYLGAWRRAVLDDVGGFDLRLTRNQDNELAERIHDAGYEVRYDAGLVVGYVAGRGPIGTVRHHHGFGRWRATQGSLGQRALGARHVAAVVGAAGVGAAPAAALLSPSTRRAAVPAVASIYTAGALGAWWTAARLRAVRGDLDLAPLHPLGVALAPAVAGVLDAAWFAGLVRGPVEPAVGDSFDGSDAADQSIDANTSSHAGSTRAHDDASAT